MAECWSQTTTNTNILYIMEGTATRVATSFER